MEKITRLNRDGQGLTAEEDLQLDVFCSGISMMYKKWTLGQYAISPAAAADCLYAMMPDSLKYDWLQPMSDDVNSGVRAPLARRFSTTVTEK